ncbi:hypothetical protein IQ07DRAFT_678729 [Pyrenochaeta sp. DS3sAY3a]|nr:hypothetical protein IQ07DRAFT_678729 [Pyrenochaeta sp. DS3sAY3a]
MATPFRVNQIHSTPGRNPLSDHAKCWKHNEKTSFLDPGWPREPPDVEAVLAVAEQYPPTNFHAEASKTWTSQGAFHKLYFFCDQTTSSTYLMRVAIPVERFYKTESEVATMKYLQKNTSIPIPKVIAWPSSAENIGLGFEWILKENVEAVTLGSVWENMAFAAKMSLTKHVACKMKELLDLRFTLLGNIYFADKWNEVGYPLLSSAQPLQPASYSESSKIDIDIGKDNNFVIGQMVSNRFFRDKSALLCIERGPYDKAKELTIAETKLLGQRIRHLPYTPGSDYYCDVDHPTTFALQAIVDWESVSIVPAWEINNGVSNFLQGNQVDEPPPTGTRSEEDEDRLVEIRRDWELSLLRKVYTDVVGPLFKTSPELENRVRLKTGFRRCLVTFEDVWRQTRSWLDRTTPRDDIEMV